MPKKQYYVPDMTGVMVTIPSGYTSRQVSGFEAVVYDGEVPIGWGFRCKGQAMETSRWESFPGERVCVGIKDAPGGERVIGEWVYVERWLKPSEAVEVYGAVSALDIGPRGGFKSVTYGVTMFCNRHMDPRGQVAYEIGMVRLPLVSSSGVQFSPRRRQVSTWTGL
jgi:hypothetical protein